MKKKTNKEFIAELQKKNASIIPVDTYVNSSTKIGFRCIVCGNEWKASPGKILSGRGCPKCSRKQVASKRRYTKEEYVRKLRTVNPFIEVLGDYINSQNKIKVHCQKCDNTWDVVPSSLLHGTGCPRCKKRYRRTSEDYAAEVHRISPHISILDEYKNAHTKIRAKCNRCGKEWRVEANSLLKGGDCPYCTHAQTSVVEQIIYIAFVSALGDNEVINRDKSAIGKELDVYVPKLKLAIEYGAWYWHEKRLKSDLHKKQLCNECGIRLISIYEGCPQNIIPTNMDDVLCYTTVLSQEKDFETIRDVVLLLCKEYGLNKSEIEHQWTSIISKGKTESRKKDSAQFAKELSKNNPNITYLGEYSGAKESVFVECKICGTQWHASSAYDLLHGHGCPICAKEKRSASQWINKDIYHSRVGTINPHIKLLEDYKGPRCKISCLCTKCGFQWKAAPQSILYKRINCPKCSPNTKISDHQYAIKFAKKNPNLIKLGSYINSRTPIEVECGLCHYVWQESPKALLNGNGCPKCNHRVKISSQEFLQKVSSKNNAVEVLEEYSNRKTKIRCQCKNCGHVWKGIPNNLIRGAGCPKCAGTLRLSNDEFRLRLSMICPDIEVQGDYVNNRVKVKCYCRKCNNTWMAMPHNLLNGHGCPVCKGINAKIRRQRRIRCVETNEVYESIKEAKQVTGISSISDCLRNRISCAGGFHWEYLD